MFTPRIVVLDDDPHFHQVLHRVLARRGYELVAHADATTAPDVVRQQQPTLVILELHLEHFDAGFTVVRALRDDPGTATIPILMMSTDWGLTCRVAGLAADGVVALSKFSDEGLLLRAVALLVARPPTHLTHAAAPAHRTHAMWPTGRPAAAARPHTLAGGAGGASASHPSTRGGDLRAGE